MHPTNKRSEIARLRFLILFYDRRTGYDHLGFPAKNDAYNERMRIKYENELEELLSNYVRAENG